MRVLRQTATPKRSTPTHLDLVLERSEHVVTIESKCLEPLSLHVAKFTAASLTVAARNAGEAQRRAWREWYGRGPADELQRLTRGACATEQTGEPVSETDGPSSCTGRGRT